VSLWDARSQLCTHTLYGHHNSCNAAVFNLAGSTIASTDADGVVKLWDVRMAAEIVTIRGAPCPANKCSFDASGKVRAWHA
jgi:WD40 repeat protein